MLAGFPKRSRRGAVLPRFAPRPCPGQGCALICCALINRWARLLCQQLGVPDEAVADIWQSHPPRLAGDELRQIYALLMGALKK